MLSKVLVTILLGVITLNLGGNTSIGESSSYLQMVTMN